MTDHAEVFTGLRPLLFTVAYEITGSATDADDILQDSYLRWAQVDLDDVENPKSYLAQVVTRQSLNVLRAAGRRREEYVGPWLPEPLLIDESDPADDLVLSESVSTAMMVLLESLVPDERAIFVLREVFGFPHDEIAVMVGKSPAAVRQAARRAREHVQSGRKRFVPAGSEVAAAASALIATAIGGDVQGVMDAIAPDVVLMSDGGGKVTAARRPIHGADKVARFLVGISAQAGEGMTITAASANGSPALVIRWEGVVGLVAVFDFLDGLVSGIYLHVNPDKLVAAESVRRIDR